MTQQTDVFSLSEKNQPTTSAGGNTLFKYLRFLPLLIAAGAASLGLRLGLILMSLHTF